MAAYTLDKGFLSKKLWKANLCYGELGSWYNNYQGTIKYLNGNRDVMITDQIEAERKKKVEEMIKEREYIKAVIHAHGNSRGIGAEFRHHMIHEGMDAIGRKAEAKTRGQSKAFLVNQERMHLRERPNPSRDAAKMVRDTI
jgi:hypothetical protein